MNGIRLFFVRLSLERALRKVDKYAVQTQVARSVYDSVMTHTLDAYENYWRARSLVKVWRARADYLSALIALLENDK